MVLVAARVDRPCDMRESGFIQNGASVFCC
jgi:hypothetical protein